MVEDTIVFHVLMYFHIFIWLSFWPDNYKLINSAANITINRTEVLTFPNVIYLNQAATLPNPFLLKSLMQIQWSKVCEAGQFIVPTDIFYFTINTF